MRFNPGLKDQINNLAQRVKEAEGKPPYTKLKDELIRLCLPPARACATRWATRIFDRLVDDIDQEVSIAISDSIDAFDPTRRNFFAYMMFRAKRGVRRLKGVYPIDVPTRVRESSIAKLKEHELDGLEVARSSFYAGLLTTSDGARDDSQEFNLIELRESLPKGHFELLMDFFVEEMEWQELEDKYQLSRKKLSVVVLKAVQRLKQVLEE